MQRKKWSVEERSAAIFIFSLLFCCLLCLCLPAVTAAASEKTVAKTSSFFLKKTPDAGIRYQDSLLFFGESTTAHLASRGVLTRGRNTTQVLADESGTKLLSPRLPYETVLDPETKEAVALIDYLANRRPPILVLSFGLNGIATFAKSPETYRANYVALIRAIKEASPETKIILQTVYPIANRCDRFEDPSAINAAISSINEELPMIASAFSDVRCIDTASVLRGNDNALDPAFDNGDGYHLTASAYQRILSYFRTHAWE